MIESLVGLYGGDLRGLLDQRDQTLYAWPRANVVADEKLELLSEIHLDVDARLRTL